MEIKSFKDLYHASPDDLKEIVRQQWQAKQNPEHHPEGNTLKHIIVVTNRAIKQHPDNINLIMAAYFHDLGKMETYGINPKTGKPTAYGHEKVSAALVNRFSGFIEEMGANPMIVEFIVVNHMKMKPHTWDVMRQSKKDKIMGDPSFGDLEGLSKVDRGGLDEDIEKDVEPNDIAVKAARTAYVDAWSEMPNIKGEMEEIERAAQDLNRDEKNYFKTSVKEIVKAFEGSEAQDLTKDIWDKLENTESNQPGLDITDVYNISDMYNKSNPKKLMRKLVTGEYKYPLIVHFDDRYHLVAGNTRLSTAAALGMTPKVFIGELNKDVPVDESIRRVVRKYTK